MHKLLMAAIAGTAMAAATPAFATADTPNASDPCHDYHVAVGGQTAIACVGYYGGNLLQGSPTPPNNNTAQDVKDDIAILLAGPAGAVQDHSGAYAPPYPSLDVSKILDNIEGLGGSNTFTLSLDTTMSGLTVIGLHFGNTPDAPDNNITAFYLFNLTTPSDTITLYDATGKLNGQGSSNAQLYTTGTPAVPEPATWAMMLIGFVGIGATIRRGRRRRPVLAQLA
jgi:hypothetical protein